MVIQSIGVMSAAKLMGAMYAIIGFIVGAFFALFSMIGFAAAPDAGAGMFAAAFGIGAIIMWPIFYGLMGFVGGALMAVVYNVVAGIVGGIEFETG